MRTEIYKPLPIRPIDGPHAGAPTDDLARPQHVNVRTAYVPVPLDHHTDELLAAIRAR